MPALRSWRQPRVAQRLLDSEGKADPTGPVLRLSELLSDAAHEAARGLIPPSSFVLLHSWQATKPSPARNAG